MIIDQADHRRAVTGGAEAPRAIVGRHQAADGGHMAHPARPQRLVARIARHRIGDLGVLGPWGPAQQSGVLVPNAVRPALRRIGDGECLDALDLHGAALKLDTGIGFFGYRMLFY